MRMNEVNNKIDFLYDRLNVIIQQMEANNYQINQTSQRQEPPQHPNQYQQMEANNYQINQASQRQEPSQNPNQYQYALHTNQ